MFNPTVSVVMPVYNAEKFLDDAIQSILNQTYKDFEFIIINDGSADGSLTIIEKYQRQDNRIIVINRENRGLISSLDEGIEKAKGKYIARMDADDVSLPLRFEKQLQLIENNHIDMCGCHFFVIDESNNYLSCYITATEEFRLILRLSLKNPFAHSCIMVKKQFLEQYTYEQTKYKSVEDYDMWIRLFEHDVKMSNVDDFLFKVRNNNSSFSKTKLKVMKQEKKIISDNFIKKHNKILQKVIDKLMFEKLIREEEVLMFLLSINLKYKFFQVCRSISIKSFFMGVYVLLFRN